MHEEDLYLLKLNFFSLQSLQPCRPALGLDLRPTCPHFQKDYKAPMTGTKDSKIV